MVILWSHYAIPRVTDPIVKKTWSFSPTMPFGTDLTLCINHIAMGNASICSSTIVETAVTPKCKAIKQDGWTAPWWKVVKYLPVLSLGFEVKTKRILFKLVLQRWPDITNAYPHIPPSFSWDVLQCIVNHPAKEKKINCLNLVESPSDLRKNPFPTSQESAFRGWTKTQHEFNPYISQPFCSHSCLLMASFLGSGNAPTQFTCFGLSNLQTIF